MADLGSAQLGAIVGAAGAVLVLTAGRRATLVAGFVLLAVAEVALVGSAAVPARLVSPTLVVLAAAAVAVVVAVAAALARRPGLVIPLVLVAAPFRLPLDFGREHRFFVAVAEPGQLGRLLPLYAVLAATTALLVWQTLRSGVVRPLPRMLAWSAAAFIALASLSLLWSDDVHAGVNVLAYFLLPFAVLVAVVGRAQVEPWLPRALAIAGVALGLVFAVVGLVQAWTGTLLFYAPNLEISNSYGTYFRVTSLFRDPSLYGRHVVLAIAIVLVAAWLGRVNLWVAAAVVGLLWAGLYFSYSQSSFVALFVVTAWIVLAAGGRTARRVVLAGSIAVVVAAGALAAAAVAESSAKRVTSDRSRRVELTAKVYRHHPFAGVGLGAQPLATQRVAVVKGPVARFVSHATPLTVAAELGTLGILLAAVLFAAAVRAVAEVRRRDVAVGTALGAVLLALFVHSLFYSGFFEDPVTWFALGLAAAFLGAASPAAASMRVERRAGLAVTALLGLLVALAAPELGADPQRFGRVHVESDGLLGPIVRAADGAWDLGVVRAPAYLAGLLVVAAALVGLRVRVVAPRRARRSRRGRRRPADPPGDAARGRPPRRLAAERLHQRLDLPDRARRRPRPRRPRPLRARLPRHRAPALVRDGPAADGPGRGGALALRVLPRDRDCGGGVAAAAEAARRLPAARPPLHARAAPGGAPRPRPVRRTGRSRRRARREPRRRAGALVRDRRRPEPAARRARVRVRRARPARPRPARASPAPCC